MSLLLRVRSRLGSELGLFGTDKTNGIAEQDRILFAKPAKSGNMPQPEQQLAQQRVRKFLEDEVDVLRSKRKTIPLCKTTETLALHDWCMQRAGQEVLQNVFDSCKRVFTSDDMLSRKVSL